MGIGTTLQPHEAARMGESILAESKRMAAEIETLKEKLESQTQKFDELNEKYKKLREFEPLLEDEATILQVFIREPRVLRLLQGRALKAFGASGQHPETIDKENDVLRRRARMNYDTIIAGCLDYALGPAWNTVYARYIKPVVL